MVIKHNVHKILFVRIEPLKCIYLTFWHDVMVLIYFNMIFLVLSWTPKIKFKEQ